jgi:hypothetical protein
LRNPFGGSIVAFTPPCKIVTGKLVEGIDVSHKRNLLLGSNSSNFSIYSSNLGMKEGHK